MFWIALNAWNVLYACVSVCVCFSTISLLFSIFMFIFIVWWWLLENTCIQRHKWINKTTKATTIENKSISTLHFVPSFWRLVFSALSLALHPQPSHCTVVPIVIVARPTTHTRAQTSGMAALPPWLYVCCSAIRLKKSEIHFWRARALPTSHRSIR